MTKENKTAQELALKPCPFCGGNPVRGLGKKTRCSLHGDPIQRVNISCNKKECSANPFIEGGDRYSSGYEKGEKFKECEERAYDVAINKWNTRALTPPSDDAVRDALEWLDAFDLTIMQARIDMKKCKTSGKGIDAIRLLRDMIENNISWTIRQALQSRAGQEGEYNKGVRAGYELCSAGETLEKGLRKLHPSRADAVDVDELRLSVEEWFYNKEGDISVCDKVCPILQDLISHMIDQGYLTQKPDDVNLDSWARFIVEHHEDSFYGDHACKECHPFSEILKEGFKCAYHQALEYRSNKAQHLTED